eukprot:7649590-Ditylum_brightwellii.AAC.1
MWRKSAVALAPNLRVAATVVVALQAIAAFQVTAALALALVLVLCQMAAREVMTITMWRTPAWNWNKERYLHLVTLIQPSSI